jgi:hypothetical protein
LATIGRFFQDPGANYFLFGPRGTGKSTWLRETSPDALWIDLLAPEVHRQLAARTERLRELWRRKSASGSTSSRPSAVKHAATVRSADLRGLKAFREDYPEADLRLLYRGRETLEIDGIRCLPCEDFLRRLIPGRALP